MTFIAEKVDDKFDFDLWFSRNFHSKLECLFNDNDNDNLESKKNNNPRNVEYVNYLKELGRDTFEIINEKVKVVKILEKVARILSVTDFKIFAFSLFQSEKVDGNLCSLVEKIGNSYAKEKWTQSLLLYHLQSEKNSFASGKISKKDISYCCSKLTADRLMSVTCMDHNLIKICVNSMVFNENESNSMVFNENESNSMVFNENDSLLESLIKKFLYQIWCDPIFIKHESNIDSHENLAKWLMFALKALDDNLSFQVPCQVFQVIPLYLDHWIQEIRVLAMFVAEKIVSRSKEMENLNFGLQGNPIYEKWNCFYHQEEQEVKEVQEVKEKVQEVKEVKEKVDSKSINSNKSSCEIANVTKRLSLALAQKNDFNSDDSDDDDSLLSSIAEDKISCMLRGDKVLYLRDAIGLLKDCSDTGAKDKRAAALQSLPELLFRPDVLGIRDVALDLTNALLHLDSSTIHGIEEEEDKERLRNLSMAILIYRCADIVAPYLYNEFFSNRLNMGQRLALMIHWIPGVFELREDTRASPTKKDTRTSPTNRDVIVGNSKVIWRSKKLDIARNSKVEVEGEGEGQLQLPSISNIIPFLVIPLLNALYSRDNVQLILGRHPLLHRATMACLHLLYKKGIVGSIHEERLSKQLDDLLTGNPMLSVLSISQ